MTQQIIASEVTGSVWKIEVEQGFRVAVGDVLMIIESMKMEVPVEATVAGVVSSLDVGEGDAVVEGQRVASLEPG